MEKSEDVTTQPVLDRLKADLNRRERTIFSSAATFSNAGMRRHPIFDSAAGYRQAFSLDADRILHSRAYTRYNDKTQVFSLIANDHITHRVLHVQLVSKIGRTIGRFLRLNEDLIEAIALGHDIGHTPFGHEGERYLSELCLKAGIGNFLHNVQSIQFLDRVERKGQGWNLCLQTLDGILCHDGEIHNRLLTPQPDKTFSTFEAEISTKKANPALALVPMTTEGCVVRMADTIAYIGRDLEDAIRLGLLKRGEIPASIVRILGNSNGTIVYRLVTDIIQNSYANRFIAFSPGISDALKNLKTFNLNRIYTNPKNKVHSATIKKLFGMLFDTYLEDLTTGNRESDIFSGFLADMSDDYVEDHSHPEIVRDYIAGMTDSYFLNRFPAHLRPVVQI
ncbi:deoxyguanosinetriphosphate triphosphohydrolase-like protein [Desulfosarcina ovata subsp. sediminis]|uniref:Deoxyguanosinetriphosphate triphosphohydrolase-like protein n=1 Tax=Desulfosarcina ovata subsp. sediminis TaxID=885957 RepID=A0A5K7ZHE0_9BACT|nr:HD domain-containing protein [Desulfosarcina ovata]BBO79685.1 deoxyguanosinetriphosphate triphosphohydrolase-like protein [Desulfosarcina ovata subsp. sediminis]